MLIKRLISTSSLMICLLILSLSGNSVFAQVYELRTYTTNKGKLNNLHARFRDHTINIFNKHGMKSVGYWVPVDEAMSKNTLIYVLEHNSLSEAKSSWQDFGSDPQWQKVAKESQVNGRILAKAPESIFMTAADYSPVLVNRGKSDTGVFELRTYQTNSGKLENLDARFRDNTIRIFNRYRMDSIAYWHPVNEPDVNDTLVYILRHNSVESAKTAWAGFIGDQEWKKVAVESQIDGRILKARPESIFMKATDYSPVQ